MARTGQMLEESGETIEFLATADDTGGELMRCRMRVKPDRPAPPEHSHPQLEERFLVEAGRMGYVLGDRRLEASKGETVVVPPGTNHTFWNAGRDELSVTGEIRPAMRFEDFVETIHVLIRDGRLPAGGGGANPLQLAVIAQAYRREWRLTRLGRAARAMLPAVALVGRLAGYRAFYSANGETQLSKTRTNV